jgi:hypothetical protein
MMMTCDWATTTCLVASVKELPVKINRINLSSFNGLRKGYHKILKLIGMWVRNKTLTIFWLQEIGRASAQRLRLRKVKKRIKRIS